MCNTVLSSVAGVSFYKDDKLYIFFNNGVCRNKIKVHVYGLCVLTM